MRTETIPTETSTVDFYEEDELDLKEESVVRFKWRSQGLDTITHFLYSIKIPKPKI